MHPRRRVRGHKEAMNSTGRVPWAQTLAGALVALGLYACSRYSYLLFHGLAEVFSIVIGAAVFLFALNARRFVERDYFLFLGIAFLFVAGLDFVHTLAYKGMNIFLVRSSACTRPRNIPAPASG